MILTKDVVTCFNDMISAHRCIWEFWHNPVMNTFGPQVDRILLKSFKLFPQLDSTATEDVVNFYDRLQELSTSHLIAITRLTPLY
jgi:regulator of sigma D